ncbi:MAG: hypothetical protein LBO05_09610 [Deltaproteobacteria bacterium]|jgi:hypothetical protein|nr:hypothetical protein [Deltaproteobacteria bacterium]
MLRNILLLGMSSLLILLSPVLHAQDEDADRSPLQPGEAAAFIAVYGRADPSEPASTGVSPARLFLAATRLSTIYVQKGQVTDEAQLVATLAGLGPEAVTREEYDIYLANEAALTSVMNKYLGGHTFFDASSALYNNGSPDSPSAPAAGSRDDAFAVPAGDAAAITDGDAATTDGDAATTDGDAATTDGDAASADDAAAGDDAATTDDDAPAAGDDAATDGAAAAADMAASEEAEASGLAADPGEAPAGDQAGTTPADDSAAGVPDDAAPSAGDSFEAPAPAGNSSPAPGSASSADAAVPSVAAAPSAGLAAVTADAPALSAVVDEIPPRDPSRPGEDIAAPSSFPGVEEEEEAPSVQTSPAG